MASTPPRHAPHDSDKRLSLRRGDSSMDLSPIAERLMRRQSQLDEGYSEETRSTADSDSDMVYALDALSDTGLLDMEMEHKVNAVVQAALSLPPLLRKRVAADVVKALANEDKEDIVRLIEHWTHFDPAVYLPNELFLHVLSYLSPADLLNASRVSRAWRERALDEKIWRHCFAREGWLLDRNKMAAFEQLAERRGKRIAEGTIRVPPLERRESRKRPREEAFSSEGEQSRVNVDGTVETDDGGEGMEGVEMASRTNDGLMGETDVMMDTRPSTSGSTALPSIPPSPADVRLAPTLFQTSDTGPKVSWPYLYKQRRRLETNWEKGHYKMFQLPHPDHREEGHRECVYTIQHTARHLVSGSRDHTIRIWDLPTQRLKMPPLVGHEMSVLCLQFDERTDQDIIVSGGSDGFMIVWKFSTGEIIKKMTRAHTESVLNLRFDERYIVTCSKDKTIKIWNRHALRKDSPLIPTYVFAEFNTPHASEMIAEYTLLATLTGHHAAVNAVMIHENTIVSASGDRTVHAWDLHKGMVAKNYLGHNKGIACVQFDGRRVVSGSSDNSVRIFDAESGGEIACLQGHTDLVRTVQARFGDLTTTTDDELAAESKKADRAFFKAVNEGMQPATVSSRGPRNAGSSRPEDMLALGTKMPPGGGGSRWAKIVSGSYDETVILWKKDSEGKWCVKLRLSSDSTGIGGRRTRNRAQFPGLNAAFNAVAPVPAGAQAGPVVAAGSAPGTTTTAIAAAANPPALNPTQVAQAHHHIATAQNHLQHATQLLQAHGPGNTGFLPPSQLMAITSVQNALGVQLQQHQQQQSNPNNNQQSALPASVNASAASTAAQPSSSRQPTMQAAQTQGTQTTQTTQTPTSSTHTTTIGPSNTTTTHTTTQPQPQPQTQSQAQAQAQAPAATAGPAQQTNTAGNAAPPVPAGGAALAAAQHAAHHATTRETNRVFKLQFDARRIICCSQNKVIVGWDFANGDLELERVGEWSLETA